jgi:hypothetical protein
VVGSQENGSFGIRLGDQYSVERVLVQGRQAVDREGVFARDCDLLITGIEQAAP